MTTAAAADVRFERAGLSTIDLAMPLLVVQMQEHGIDLEAMGEGQFTRAVRGLVEVPGRGAVLFARRVADGQVIGVAVLAHTWTIDRGGAATWLDELYVLPEERSRGVGTALLRRAIELARAEGFLALDLEVDEGHARAADLYVREGFMPFRRRHFTRALT